MYQFQQGPTEQKILEICYRERRPVPQAIKNAPELTMGLELFYEAFFHLQTDRQLGMSEGPISWTSIERYAKKYDMEEDQCDRLHYHLSRMDAAYFRHQREKGGK